MEGSFIKEQEQVAWVGLSQGSKEMVSGKAVEKRAKNVLYS